MSRVKYKTKNELAYEDIKFKILRGYIKPGSKLIIQKISKSLGFSDIPVREAFKKLEAEGLVHNNPHRGFIVTEPDFKNKNQIFEVRQLLECYAVRMTASKISTTALQKLDKLIVEMKKKLALNDMFSFANLNYQFHDTIYACCGNPILYKLIQQTWGMTPRTQAVFSLVKGRAKSSIKEHEEIYEYLKLGHAKKAEEALFNHKKKSYDLLYRYSKKSERKVDS